MGSHATELTADSLLRARQFFVHALIIAVLTVVAAVVASLWFRAAAVPVGALAAGEGFVVMCAHYVHRDVLQRLALDPTVTDISAVQQYREGLLRQPSRDRLAASINSLLADARLPHAFCLTDRVTLVEEQLRLLARELATPEVSVQARSFVACLRLVSHGVESPLFNPGLPVEQLHATLLRIQFGIRRAETG
jgi:hypothetical protein